MLWRAAGIATGSWRLDRLAEAVGVAADVLRHLASPTPIHGDVRCGNVLLDASGCVQAVLDYESVMRAPYALEHAIALRNLATREWPSWCHDRQPLDRTLAAAYLGGYERTRGRRLSRVERTEVAQLLPLAYLSELAFVQQIAASLPAERRTRLTAIALRQLMATSVDVAAVLPT